jgi:quercetin dioxygenase-like cupin family protein
LRGAGFVIEKQNEVSMFQIVGPVENTGRLKYIDGCSDSLLISPMKMGDACLNHLHFPAGIRQTMHTHPTVRVGVVLRGSGVCVTPTDKIPLVPGVGWFLPEGSPHCFHTEGNTMDVIAWHPDTDTGPNDEDHPMLNRTYVDGTSARYCDTIRTK